LIPVRFSNNQEPEKSHTNKGGREEKKLPPGFVLKKKKKPSPHFTISHLLSSFFHQLIQLNLFFVSILPQGLMSLAIVIYILPSQIVDFPFHIAELPVTFDMSSPVSFLSIFVFSRFW
jgi:hypothetical protein